MTEKLSSPQQVFQGGIFPPPPEHTATDSYSTHSAPISSYDPYSTASTEYSYDTFGASSRAHYGLPNQQQHDAAPYSGPMYIPTPPPPQTPSFYPYYSQPDTVYTAHFPTPSPYSNFERVAENLTNPSPTSFQQNYHSTQNHLTHPSLSPSDHHPSGRISYSTLTFVERLGRGGFGSVQKVTYNGKNYAVKLFHTANSLEQLQREFGKLSELRHRNIVPVYAYFYKEPDQSVGDVHLRAGYVMEFQNCGSLRSFLQRRSSKGFREQEALFFARQIASALIYLYDQHIIHNDIKPENICLHMDQDHPTRAKLLDFGAALNRGTTEFSETRREKTLAYTAPERFDKHGTCFASDVYSFGIVLNEMVGGEKPFKGLETFRVVDALKNGLPPAKIPDVSPHLKQLITRCWHRDPRKRPKPAEIITIIDQLRDERVSF